MYSLSGLLTVWARWLQIGVCMCEYIYIYIYIYIFTYIYTHLFICTYIYIWLYVHVNVHTLSYVHRTKTIPPGCRDNDRCISAEACRPPVEVCFLQVVLLGAAWVPEDGTGGFRRDS